jgi:hypothetical protein
MADTMKMFRWVGFDDGVEQLFVYAHDTDEARYLAKETIDAQGFDDETHAHYSAIIAGEPEVSTDAQAFLFHLESEFQEEPGCLRSHLS